MIYRIAALVSMLLISVIVWAQPVPNVAGTGDFQALLDRVRSQSGVKGIAVSIIESGKPARVLTTGFADIERGLPVNEQTQFRFGSVSKILVGLSVMKLVEQGQLSLDANVRELVPEIRFTNRWAASYPLKVRHLLNHNTGWDAMHFAENVPQPGSPVSIRQALELHPHSRVSRWPPGSRFAYNNTGYLVAAYIVEKFSGLTYESFVQTRFFTPLQMASSDYFYTDDYRKHAATLYLGNQPLPYTHLNNRAAGGLNSSIADMSELVRFLISQGHSTEQPILSSGAFQMLQTPAGTLSADAGIEFTYAQGVNLFHANGKVLFGHEGSVRGGSALLAYQPELGKGYVIAVNGEGPAVAHIHQFLANMITQTALPAIAEVKPGFTASDRALAGSYRVINPTASLVAPFSTLMPWNLHVTGQQASIGPLFGLKPRQLGSKGNNLMSQWETGQVVLTQNEDPIAGLVLQYGPMTLKRVSPVSAYAPLFIVLVWVLTAISAIVFMFIWLPRKWQGNSLTQASIRLRRWPLITLMPLLCATGLILHAKSSPDMAELVGKPSWLALGLAGLSILFLIAALWSVYVWWRTPRSLVKPWVYWHSAVLILLNAVIAFYLLVNGLIGIRLWA